MKQEKEFDRSICFTFFESYLEQAEHFQKLFGTEVAFNYLIGLIKYALYQEESDDPMTQGLVSGLKNTIDSGQDKRSKGFNKEDFEQTKVVAEYYRDHPESSQRAIATATGLSKTKVQKTLAKLKESGMTIGDYITHVINPNLNTNTNSTSNPNPNSETKTETTAQSSSSTTELADAQTKTAAPSNEKEEKEKKIIKGTKRILEDLTDDELIELNKDFQRKMTYKNLQTKYNLSEDVTNADLGKNIKQEQEKRKEQKIILKQKEFESKIEQELIKNPDKKKKLKEFTECTTDSQLFRCLKDIGRDPDDVIKFYEENKDSTNDNNELMFTRWIWKLRESGNFSTYEIYIRDVMDSSGYSKIA